MRLNCHNTACYFGLSYEWMDDFSCHHFHLHGLKSWNNCYCLMLLRKGGWWVSFSLLLCVLSVTCNLNRTIKGETVTLTFILQFWLESFSLDFKYSQVKSFTADIFTFLFEDLNWVSQKTVLKGDMSFLFSRYVTSEAIHHYIEIINALSIKVHQTELRSFLKDISPWAKMTQKDWYVRNLSWSSRPLLIFNKEI